MRDLPAGTAGKLIREQETECLPIKLNEKTTGLAHAIKRQDARPFQMPPPFLMELWRFFCKTLLKDSIERDLPLYCIIGWRC